jgi:hypothetical protein
MTVDDKKIVRSANRSLSGLSVQHLVGTPLLNWASPSDRDAYDAALDLAFQSGEETSLEFNGLGPDQSTVRYATRIAPLRIDGQVQSLCVLSQILPFNPPTPRHKTKHSKRGAKAGRKKE